MGAQESQSTFSFVNDKSQRQEVKLDVTEYKAASAAGLTLSQYLATTYKADTRHGSTMEQFMASAGMFIRPDAATGLRPPTMRQVMEGGVEMMAGAITRNDGSNSNTPSGRLLFPEVILQIIASELTENKDDFINGYQSLIAQTQNVTSAKVDQPVIDVTAPEGSKSQPISQLAEPAAMVTITVSDASYRIPTNSIGLSISDEALGATTLDLVGLAISSQAREQRVTDIEQHLSGMISGDVDRGETALSAITANSLDSTLAAGQMSQKAWIHYLRDNYRKMTITNILCDIDTALLIEGRSGKPTINDDDPRTPRIDALFSIENMGLSAPRILLLDSAFIGANTVVGLDNRSAIRQTVNVNATYQAIEEYVMRRSTSFRFDYGATANKLYTDAWRMMTLT